MTYSPESIGDVQRLTQLMVTLARDLATLRRLVDICGDVVDMPSRRPDVDPDNTGRRATSGPSRPTEQTALDPGRVLVSTELESSVTRVASAIAYIRGSTAALDRALATWEGAPAPVRMGETMRVLTGPQRTSDERGALAELAGFHGLVAPTGAEEFPWWDVTELYTAEGWERCPLALADVQIAEALGVVVTSLPVVSGLQTAS